MGAGLSHNPHEVLDFLKQVDPPACEELWPGINDYTYVTTVTTTLFGIAWVYESDRFYVAMHLDTDLRMANRELFDKSDGLGLPLKKDFPVVDSHGSVTALEHSYERVMLIVKDKAGVRDPLQG